LETEWQVTTAIDTESRVQRGKTLSLVTLARLLQYHDWTGFQQSINKRYCQVRAID